MAKLTLNRPEEQKTGIPLLTAMATLLAFVASAVGAIWLLPAMLISNKLARMWPGGPTAFDLHQYTSLLSLAFVLFHAVILLGDRYINYTLIQIVLPFNSTSYKLVWVGIGQLTFYGALIVSLTFYVRQTIISQTVWHIVHLASYVLFITAMVHGLWSGTDSGTPWATLMYWVAGVSTLFFTVYRILAARVARSAAMT